MRTASPKQNVIHRSPNELAPDLCQRAFQLKDKGDYAGAQRTMRPFWKAIGERPEIQGLYAPVAAEVLFCVGALTGWIGSKDEIKWADNTARDLLTESITLFESVGDDKKVAEVRAELGYCYWRAGALDEARIMFRNALRRLTAGNARANALLGLSVVEWTDSRCDEALQILTENAPLFEKIPNHTIKGFYHNQYAMVLRGLATKENQANYFRRAIKEYEQADVEFKAAHNSVYRAHVKNNIGFLLFKLSRFRKAHEYLLQARRLTVAVRDRVRTAQVSETRAQVFIAERKYAEAEAVARSAVTSFERAGRQCLLAEALITQGIALARLDQKARAQFTFQRAIQTAHQSGALHRAGMAALTLIEETDAPTDILQIAYQQSREWLIQSPELQTRLDAAGKKVDLALSSQAEKTIPLDTLFIKRCHLGDEVLRFERRLIKDTLAKVNGSVTHAAKLLGISYQRLGYVIESRHKDLLKERSPVIRRPPKDRSDN